jgi:hypothetical protein
VTGEEWLACADPTAMLEFLRDKGNDRKLRLFACACRRRIAHRLPHDSDRDAIDEVEWHVDQEGGISQIENKESQAGSYYFSRYVVCYWNADDPHERYVADAGPAFNAAVAAAWDSASAAGEVFFADSKTYGDDPDAEQLERITQARLLRDIFGNPFRPVQVKRSWLTSTVQNLAAVAYEERNLPSGELDAARVAVLADALEDAGCTDGQVLDHLRGPGPHVRGCWAIDLVLARR